MNTIGTEEKLAELKRERALRQRVYPNRIHFGKMTQAEADRHMLVPEAIIRDYERELGQADMFQP